MSERDYLNGSRRPGIVLLQPETDYANFKKSEFFGLLREIRVIRGSSFLSRRRHPMRNTEFLGLRDMGTCSQPDRNTQADRFVLRGLMGLFSGLGLMVQLHSMNVIMAHHWSAPRHWLGKTCYLERVNSTMDHHPDGHALEEKILFRPLLPAASYGDTDRRR